MKMNPEEITSIIKERIKNYDVDLNVNDVGTVLEVGDGIAHIIGIDNSDMRFKTSGGFAFIRDDRVSILIEKTEEAIPLD